MPFVRPLVVALRLVRELRNLDSLMCGFGQPRTAFQSTTSPN